MREFDNLPSFAALRAFAAYGHTGGVRRAAQALNVDQAIVSRHLRGLEERLGVRLVDRAAGQLTTVGNNYHEAVLLALRTLSAATAQLTGPAQIKALRICCVPGFAHHWLAARLGDLQRTFIKLPLELKQSDEPANLAAGEADADIRYVRGTASERELAGSDAWVLATPAVYPVAKPNFGPVFASAAALLNAPLLHEDSDIEWRQWLAGQGMHISQVPCAARLWHAHTALAAARAGQGIALANDFLVADDLASGRLVRVEMTETAKPVVTIGAYILYLASGSQHRPALGRLRDWLVREASGFQACD